MIIKKGDIDFLIFCAFSRNKGQINYFVLCIVLILHLNYILFKKHSKMSPTRYLKSHIFNTLAQALLAIFWSMIDSGE